VPIGKTKFVIKFEQVNSLWEQGIIWRLNNKPMQYGHNGAALYIEEIPNGKRYYCNDGSPDDDFDDLVFTIEKVQE